MAHEDAGRPLQSAGTDASRSNQSRGGPSRERRATTTSKNGDGTDFPRYFLQLGNDIKRSRAYEMIQELQLMVCNKDTGVRGNKGRARAMVLLKEVQAVLTGLENKLDAQTFDLGVFNVERSELRKELRDEKSKEVQPLHTVDFRNTEVRELPHKLRILFEDNQVLREQVRALQYAVRSAESRLEVSERKVTALELENATLSVALREAGSSPDMAQEMRQLREVARSSQVRSQQLETQVVSLLDQLETDRRLASQQARSAAAKQALLESRLNSALGIAAATRVGGASGAAAAVAGGGGGGGVVRKTSGRAGSAGADASAAAAAAAEAAAAATGGSGVAAVEAAWPPYVGGSQQDGGDGRSSGIFRPYSNPGGQSAGGSGSLGGVSGGAGGAGGGTRGRDRSASPPRSPNGRSISHSPGSGIPTLYPLFNTKPRPTHAFSADAATWHSASGVNPSSPSTASAAGGGPGGSSSLPLAYPSPPSAVLNRNYSGSALLERSAGGPISRPQSGGPGLGLGMGHPGQQQQGPGMEVLQGGGGRSQASTSAGAVSAPGEPVRAINSTAVLTSRTLLPSVSGGNGGGGMLAAAGAAPPRPPGGGGGGAGILGLRVFLGAGGSPGTGAAGGGGGGGGAGQRPSSGYSGGPMVLVSDPPHALRPSTSAAASGLEDYTVVANGEFPRVGGGGVGGYGGGGGGSGESRPMSPVGGPGAAF